MLTRLHIRHLAVLEEIELDLKPGFTVLTGETGAGKSMLVDALALALGERADSGAVRAGADRAEITALFEVGPGSPAEEWLIARDLDSASECHVRRIVTCEGRSRGYINGQQVPMEVLRELGGRLFEICGQHAHHSLAHRVTQREILDAHGGHGPLLAEVSRLHLDWTALESERTALLDSQSAGKARLELIGYQLRELQALNLQAGEAEALEQERLLLANAGRIASGLNEALETLHDAEQSSVHDGLATALRELQALATMDPELRSAVDCLEHARIQLGDAVTQIRRRVGGLEHDPDRQGHVEARLASILELARKHRVEPENLWQLTPALEAEVADLTGSDDRLEAMALESTRLGRLLRLAAGTLSSARSKAAKSLAGTIVKHLHALGMPAACFSVRVEPLPAGEVSAAGSDQVVFMISTNAGQTPGLIGKIASGGELSRLSLAIQVAAMAQHGAPTLIFDEVDAGIGGRVAEIVGHSLRRLSAHRQVLCVTHLAQVATQADHHFAVSKSAAGDSTETTVRELSASDRIEEVARMLGGVKITDRTRDHAKEMLRDARPRRAG